MKTIAIIGGTGGTGKWAVKGALLKGYKVNIVSACQLHLHLRSIHTEIMAPGGFYCASHKHEIY